MTTFSRTQKQLFICVCIQWVFNVDTWYMFPSLGFASSFPLNPSETLNIIAMTVQPRAYHSREQKYRHTMDQNFLNIHAHMVYVNVVICDFLVLFNYNQYTVIHNYYYFFAVTFSVFKYAE